MNESVYIRCEMKASFNSYLVLNLFFIDSINNLLFLIATINESLTILTREREIKLCVPMF